MELVNQNNKNKGKLALKRCLSALFISIPVIFSQSLRSQDLASGTELKDSPLSISLSTAVPMSVNNQTQQLVINQYGIRNTATITQLAQAGNHVSLQQDGIDNLANLVQTGYGNTIILHQVGSGNQAEVIQEGNANVANIRQEGEQRFIVHQIGNNMVVNITQY